MGDHHLTEVISPPWGYLPAEQFLIHHWNWESPTSPNEQRRLLISQFRNSVELPPEYAPDHDNGKVHREPTAEEINQVLRPWRSTELRKVAEMIYVRLYGEFIILRTYYGESKEGKEEGDATLQRWIEMEEENDDGFEEEALWCRILNDPAVFDVGDEWERVLDILPELAGRTYENALQRGISQSSMARALGDDNPVNAIQWVAFRDSSELPILVADKMAFETDNFLVLFLDGHGNLVRSSRLAVEDMTEFKELHRDARIDHYEWWTEAEVGPEYKPTGTMGRALYPPDAFDDLEN